MKKIILVLVAIVAVAASASIVTSNYYKKEPTLIQSLHLPLTAIVAAEEQNLIVFTNVDSTENNGMDVVTLWVYRPKSGKLLKLLTTNPNGEYECLGYGDKAKRVSLASIPTISSVFINAEEDKLLVEGFDERNSYVYIISLRKGFPTIQLPCNAGLYGMSSEEELPVGQSYDYYNKGGRYNIISVFDWNGNCLEHMSLKNLHSQNSSEVQLYVNQLEKCFRKIANKTGHGYCDYFLVDMNNDGTPELFVKSGHCEADFMLNAYTITNGRIREIYRTDAGHRDFQKGEGYLIMVETHTGTFFSYKLTMKGNKIEEVNLVSMDPSISIADFDYPEYSEPTVEFHDHTDIQPIKDAFNVFGL